MACGCSLTLGGPGTVPGSRPWNVALILDIREEKNFSRIWWFICWDKGMQGSGLWRIYFSLRSFTGKVLDSRGEKVPWDTRVGGVGGSCIHSFTEDLRIICYMWGRVSGTMQIWALLSWGIMFSRKVIPMKYLNMLSMSKEKGQGALFPVYEHGGSGGSQWREQGRSVTAWGRALWEEKTQVFWNKESKGGRSIESKVERGLREAGEMVQSQLISGIVGWFESLGFCLKSSRQTLKSQ